MLEAARQAIADGVNQYPPGRGIAPLRQAIAAHTRRHQGLEYDPDTEVLVTTGATEALAATIQAYVDPGDEVIALEPFYDSYAASIDLAGGVRVGVGLFGPDFRLDHAELAAAFGPRTKLVLINSPHNPTGVVLGDDDLAAIARLAVEHDVLVVTDEVYEHLVFDGAVHRSLATFPGMRERTIRISSAGKTFSATGWKIGWAMGPRGADRRGDGGQAVPHLRLRRPVPAGGRPRARRGRRLGRARRRRDLQDRRDQLADGLASVGLDAGRAAGDVLHDHRRAPARLRGRGGVLPRPAAPGRRRRDPAPGVLRRRRGRPAVRALGVLQARARCWTRPSAGSAALALAAAGAAVAGRRTSG